MSKTASRIVSTRDERACCTPGAGEPGGQVAALDEAQPKGDPAAQRGRGARAARSDRTPEARTSALVARLKALADPTRLRMLELLAQHDAPICVCEITPQFELHQPTISHHLRLLREAGLVDCERRGVWAYYWATEAGKRSLVSLASLS